MKISVNDSEVFTLSETQKKVIKNEIADDIFESDMKRRLRYILEHKYKQCFARLKQEWEPKLKANGVTMVPTDDAELAELIFNQPDYKNATQRQLEDEGDGDI